MIDSTEIASLYGEMSMEELYERWLAAFRYFDGLRLIKQQDIGVLAAQIEGREKPYGRGYINNILHARVDKRGKVITAGGGLQKIIPQVFERTYLDFIEIGGQILKGDTAPDIRTTATPDDPKFELHVYKMWEQDEIAAMSADELTREVSEYGDHLQSAFTQLGQLVTKRVSMLAQERNRLRTENNHGQAVLNSMSDAVKVQTRDRVIRYANMAFKRLVGREDCIGQPCATFCEEDDGSECYVLKVFATGRGVSDIKLYNDRWYGVRCAPIFNDAQQVRSVVTVLRDITEEHERALNGDVKQRDDG